MPKYMYLFGQYLLTFIISYEWVSGIIKYMYVVIYPSDVNN